MRYLRHLLYCDTTGWIGSAGLLVLRLVMGTAFILHGSPKIQQPFGWMPPEAGIPSLLQALAALAEFGGGLALIPGLLTRLASLGLANVMFVAAFLVHMRAGDPFVATKLGTASYEPALVYLACAILFLLMGPGRFSLDALLFGRRNETESQL